MEHGSEVGELARRLFASYLTGDRATMEKLLAEDFTFTSPNDDRIDRAAYFERCWPNAGAFASFELERVAADGAACVVVYEATLKTGKRFRNAELFRGDGGRIRSVEVFFGRTLEEARGA